MGGGPLTGKRGEGKEEREKEGEGRKGVGRYGTRMKKRQEKDQL